MTLEVDIDGSLLYTENGNEQTSIDGEHTPYSAILSNPES
jgi:hypothetical protein